MNYIVISSFFFKHGIQDARTYANEDKEKEKDYRYCSLMLHISLHNYISYKCKKSHNIKTDSYIIIINCDS